jgi:DNA adenine methylase
VQYAKEAFNINLKDRLEGVTVENDDALKVIKRYDVPHAFHFIDPPYVGSNMGHYSNMFNETHLKELLELCTMLEGKFMLTMYPNEVIESYASSHG